MSLNDFHCAATYKLIFASIRPSSERAALHLTSDTTSHCYQHSQPQCATHSQGTRERVRWNHYGTTGACPGSPPRQARTWLWHSHTCLHFHEEICDGPLMRKSAESKTTNQERHTFSAESLAPEVLCLGLQQRSDQRIVAILDKWQPYASVNNVSFHIFDPARPNS
jgi:hypothetical protein